MTDIYREFISGRGENNQFCKYISQHLFNYYSICSRSLIWYHLAGFGKNSWHSDSFRRCFIRILLVVQVTLCSCNFDFFFTGSSKNINQILISRNIWAVWINASITLFLFFCEEIDVHDLTLLRNVMRWWYSFFKSLREQRSLIWYYNFLMFFCFDESVIIKAFLAD